MDRMSTVNATQHNKVKYYAVNFFSLFVCVCATSVKYRGARGAGGDISGQSRKEANTIHNSFEG